MSGQNELIDSAFAILDEAKRVQEPPDVDALRAVLTLLRPGTGEVEARSIYGASSHEPFVELHLGDVGVTQWTPAEARHHALVTLEAAEAAEQDAFFVTYVTQIIGASLVEAGELLQMFRGYRASQREQRS